MALYREEDLSWNRSKLNSSRTQTRIRKQQVMPMARPMMLIREYALYLKKFL
jgi:hypothetical protein